MITLKKCVSIPAILYFSNECWSVGEICVAGDQVYEIDPPNNGTLIDPLPININITGDGGFDIAPRNQKVNTDIGLDVYMVDNITTLFRIDVETAESKILARYKESILESLVLGFTKGRLKRAIL